MLNCVSMQQYNSYFTVNIYYSAAALFIVSYMGCTNCHMHILVQQCILQWHIIVVHMLFSNRYYAYTAVIVSMTM
jgi:hypothetical protein